MSNIFHRAILTENSNHENFKNILNCLADIMKA